MKRFAMSVVVQGEKKENCGMYLLPDNEANFRLTAEWLFCGICLHPGERATRDLTGTVELYEFDDSNIYQEQNSENTYMAVSTFLAENKFPFPVIYIDPKDMACVNVYDLSCEVGKDLPIERE